MKKLIVIIFVFLTVSCNRYFPVRELRFDGMKGNVESVKMSRYEAYKQFGEISKDEDDIEYVIRQKFDEDGFLIENIHYNRYGEEAYECFLTYEDGYLSEFTEVHHQRYGKNEIKGKRVELSNNYACWEYDGYDYKSTVTSFDNTMVNGCYHQIMQNENGTMVSEKYIRKDGMELIIRRFDNEGNLRLEEINELDDNDLVIEKMQVFHNSGEAYSLMLKYEYTSFDEYGNWTERIVDESGDLYVEERKIRYR